MNGVEYRLFRIPYTAGAGHSRVIKRIAIAFTNFENELNQIDITLDV